MHLIGPRRCVAVASVAVAGALMGMGAGRAAAQVFPARPAAPRSSD